MSVEENGFNVYLKGSWPYEKFDFSINPNLLDLDYTRIKNISGYYSYNYTFSHQLNPFAPLSSPVDSRVLPNSSSVHGPLYLNSDCFYENLTSSRVQLTSSCLFSWNISSTRLYSPFNLPFLYFYTHIPVLSSKDNLLPNLSIYPSKISLLPTSLTKNISSWTLETSAVLSVHSYFSKINKQPTHLPALRQHSNLLNSVRSVSTIPSFSDVYIEVDLMGNKCISNLPLIQYNSLVDSNSGSFIKLEKETYTKIRPESVFISKKYSKNNKNYTLNFPDISPSIYNNFLPYYSVVSNSSSILTLSSEPLLINLNLNSNNIDYNFTNLELSNLSSVSTDVLFKIKYIADSTYFLPITTKVINSLASLSIENNTTNYPTSLSSLRFASNINNRKITWKTLYPPHYYTYIIKATKNSNLILDANYLNFFLKSSSYFIDSKTCIISTYAGSSFSNLKYALKDNSLNDLIQYSCTDVDPVLLKNIKCFYQNNIEYSLISSPFIPISSADSLKIVASDDLIGKLSLPIKISLSSTIIGKVDFPDTNTITFSSSNLNNFNSKNFIPSIVSENSDNIILSVSDFVNEDSFPGIDLSNSLISWYFQPDNLPVVIKSLKDDYSESGTLSANTPYLFENSNKVKFSGYGASTISAFISSEKYNYSSTVSTTSSLFNSSDLVIKIGPSSPLDNSNITRTITLTANLQNNSSSFQLSSFSFFWNWYFDGVLDSSEKYIRAEVDEQKYTAGTTSFSNSNSSIKFYITPPVSDLPNLRNITAEANLEANGKIVKYSYSFLVDDFPSSNVLNANFNTYYSFSPTVPILDSSTQNTITRAEGNYNHFLFKINSFIFNTSKIKNYIWEIKDLYSNSSKVISGINASSLYLSANTQGASSISLILSEASATNWTYGHDCKSTIFLYVTSPNVLAANVAFILFPQTSYPLISTTSVTNQVTSYTTRYLAPTSINFSNIELAYPLSGTVFSDNSNLYHRYNYIINNPNNFYKTFTFSSLASDNSETIIGHTSGVNGYIDIPYSTEIFSQSGVKIILRAYNEFFPPSTQAFRLEPNPTSPGVSPSNTVFVQNPNFAYTSDFEFDSLGVPLLPPLNDFFRYNPRLVKPPVQSFSAVLIPSQNSVSLNSFNNLNIEILEFLINVTPLSARLPQLHISNFSSSVYDISSSKGSYSNILYGSYSESSLYYGYDRYLRKGPTINISLNENNKPGSVDLYREIENLSVSVKPRIYAALNKESIDRACVTVL